MITAELVTPRPSPKQRVALLSELVDDARPRLGGTLASTSAVYGSQAWLNGPDDQRCTGRHAGRARARLRATYHLAAELLALFGKSDGRTLLRADSTSIPTVRAWTASRWCTSTPTTSAYRSQPCHQPTGTLEAMMKAAKEELRQR